MPTTLLPFLYNTRTLSRLARAGHTTLRSGLNTTPARRINYSRDNDIPFELPDDLRDASIHDQNVRDSLTPNEREIFARIFDEIQRKGKTPKILTPGPPPPPPAARAPAAAPQRAPQEGKPLFLAGLLGGLDRPAGSTLRSPKPDATTAALTINAVIEDTAHNYEKTRPGIGGLDPLSPLESTYSASEREKALLRLPPTLRRAARQAYGMFTVNPLQAKTKERGDRNGIEKGKAPERAGPAEAASAGKSKKNLAKTVQIEAKRMLERKRIRDSMEACTSDREVWEIMEKSVFSLVDRLGIRQVQADNMVLQPPKPKPKPRSMKGRPKKKGVEAAEADAEAEANAAVVKAAAKYLDKAELDMETYGPMYPQLLIDGLNVLATRFSRPSPYIMQLLPRMKELGLVSYVLGVSTAFYNRLMQVLWERYGDAAVVMSLLEEMRHAGLSFNEDSLSVLNKIETAYTQANNGARGHFIKELMRTPEYEPLIVQRLRHWVGSIVANIRERDN